MANYKNTNPQNWSTVQYLRFEDGEEKELTITDWNFDKNPAGYLFKSYVTEENGQEVDKIWTIWSFESAQRMKVVLRGQKGSAKLKVKMSKEEMEQEFEISKG